MVGHGGARVVLQIEGVLAVIAVDGRAVHGLAPDRGGAGFQCNSARTFWRKTSMGTSLPFTALYQNCQPLHAEAF